VNPTAVTLWEDSLKIPNSLIIMHLKPVVAKSQEFLHNHERETLLVSRCIIGALGLSLLVVLLALAYLSFFG